ncbi:MAG: anthranilate phosphoribosyltransferase [Candidatus Sulfotelmatobacter sp.]|jgi:anthranilate phosphoribosyltransferase
MILDALHRIANHSQSLDRAEAREVMSEVLAGACTDAQIAGLLIALRMKGETVEEIVGFAEAIRAAAAPLPIERTRTEDGARSALAVSGTGRDALAGESFVGSSLVDIRLVDTSLVDTSGTGGDASGTFNISTATALVVAGAGIRVAKHGNRSISSKCGSADVVEALGMNIQLSPDRAAQCLREVGICFLYAPNLHPAMKQVQAVRRELRMRTMFNLLGPLTNPARASGQVVGVYSLDLVEKLAEALSMLGLHRALVVHGLDGLDEITITGLTRIAEARDGSVRSYEVEPEEFGIARATLQEISGGDAAQNAAIIRAVLGGEKSPRRDVVMLNAAAALVAAGRADHIGDAIPLAAESIDSGAAAKKLEKLVEFTLG